MRLPSGYSHEYRTHRLPVRAGGSPARVCVVDGMAEVTTGDVEDDDTVAGAEPLTAGLDVALADGAGGWPEHPATSKRTTVASPIVFQL